MKEVFVLREDTIDILSLKTGQAKEELAILLRNSKEAGKVYTFTIETEARVRTVQCSYKTLYRSEVGNVDICVWHDKQSKHPVTAGPNRACLEVEPWG